MVKIRSVLTLGAAALALGLAGCSSVRETLGMTKQGPDEFAVVAKQPLVIPPDYNLRPPEPGAPNRGEAEPTAAASVAVFGPNLVGTSDLGPAAPIGMGTSRPPSAGEEGLLTAAKAQNANPDIRAIINRETAQIAQESQSFTDEILFWREPDTGDVELDAAKEAARLRENAAAGLPPNAGEVPQIKRGDRAILEGIF